jgi:hypothetical protein
MFARDKFRIIERRRAVATARLAHANDNCRLERPAPVAPCRTGLVGRWRTNEQTGRLEQHWKIEALVDKREVRTRSGGPPAKGEYD